MPNFPQIDTNNDFLMTRYDDVIIDALDYQVQRTIIPEEQFSNHLSGIRDISRIPPNPFALGHILNHPPKGSLNNVVPFAYNAPLDFAHHLRYLLPFKYLRQPSFLDLKAQEILVRGLIMMASRHVEDGQELFLK